MTQPTMDELLARIDELERRLTPVPDEAGAEIWFLLDRSGSMGVIAEDVVRGFESFLRSQREKKGRAIVTLVQFDSEAPHEVLVDARPLNRVRSIRGRFQPRGLTPLYDAIGMLLDRAERHGGLAAEQLVVIYIDGLENASQHWTAQQVFARVAALQEKGWTFVFLGANQDSYATGARFAMPHGNISNFRATPEGVELSFSSLDRAVGKYRGKAHNIRLAERARFWGDVKEAEQEARPENR